MRLSPGGPQHGAYGVLDCSQAWMLSTARHECTCHNLFHPSASKLLRSATTPDTRQVVIDKGPGTAKRKGKDVVGTAEMGEEVTEHDSPPAPKLSIF